MAQCAVQEVAELLKRTPVVCQATVSYGLLGHSVLLGLGLGGLFLKSVRELVHIFGSFL